MKTNKKHLRVILPGFVAAIMLCALGSCDKDDDNTSPVNHLYSISGDANGSQVVPAVSDTGRGTISGTYDSTTHMLTYTTNWTGLTGRPTAGGFYSGASGVNGTAVGSPWTMDTTWTGTGSYSGNMTLTPEQSADLLNGGWYYSMGTSANTVGEIRGQITATPQQQ